MTSSARPEGFAQSATLVTRPSGARVRSRGTERDAARAQGRGETFELPGSITNSARPKPSLSESSAKLRSATAASLARRSGAKITGTGGASRFDGDDEKASNAERSRSPIESSQPPSPSPSDKKRAGPRVGPPPGCILIHVLDEARHERRDFTCDLRVLLKEMRYFKRHLDADVENKPNSSAEMSVHCDIPTFEWLVDDVEGRGPSMTVRNCVAVMISSDFLRMEGLTERCADFVVANLHQVSALGADLANLGEHLLEKISGRVNDDVLESLLVKYPTGDGERREIEGDGGGRDGRGGDSTNSSSTATLASKLYRLKTRALIASRSTDAGVTIGRCGACGLLYGEQFRHGLRCNRARRYVDYRGVVVARHAPMKNFDIHAHLKRLRARGHGWRDVYWHVWGVSHAIAHCGRCAQLVPASELGQCAYHPAPLEFLDQSNPSLGTRPCCGASAPRFDSTGGTATVTGCVGRDHVFPTLDVDDGSNSARFEEANATLGAARRRRGLACEPFGSRPASLPPPPPPDDDEDDDDDAKRSEMDTWRATRPYEASDTDSDSSDSFSDYSSDDSDGAKRISRTPTETQAPRYKRGTLEAARLGTNADERAERRRNARRNRLKPADPGKGKSASGNSPRRASKPESHRAELMFGLPRATYESLPKGYQRGVRDEWRDEEEARRVAAIKVRMVYDAMKKESGPWPVPPFPTVRETAARFGLNVGLGAKPDRASWLALAEMGLLDLERMKSVEEERRKETAGGGSKGRKQGVQGSKAPPSSGPPRPPSSGRWVG